MAAYGVARHLGVVMALDPVTAALEAGKAILDKIWPDAGESERQKVTMALAMFSAQAGIVQTEAASQHWLAANWRPLTMVVFVSLIVARMLGWTAPGISEDEYIRLWDIVHLGLGGYTAMRTLEKVTPSIVDAIRGRK